jgi:hypothetical protein
MAEVAKRTRIAVDVTPTVRRRIRLAAARKDLTIREYVRQALDRQLESDLATALHAADDPVLADLWDNAADGVYDRR